MASEKQKFEDLLKDAPKEPATVSLAGTLMQAHERGKFILTMAGGQTVTLEVSAVKSHEVLASSVGQTIVRVDIDRAHMPASAGDGTPVAADTARGGLEQPFTITGENTNPGLDAPSTNLYFDFWWSSFLDVPQTGSSDAPGTNVYLDGTVGIFDQFTGLADSGSPPTMDLGLTGFFDQPNTPGDFDGPVNTLGWDEPRTNAFFDNPVGTSFSDFGGGGTLQENVANPGGGMINPAAGAMAMPFSLAAQHQAPPAALAAMRQIPKSPYDPPHHPPKLIYDPPSLPWPWGRGDF